MINGQIQAFPWKYWEKEFKIASDCDFSIMEWTLDQDRIHENPIMFKAGREAIRELTKKYNISIPSLTGDCFMQAPFYKASGKQRDTLINDLIKVINCCGLLGIKMIVFPLVDNGSIESKNQEDILKDGFKTIDQILKISKVKIIFESDLSPKKLKDFIAGFSSNLYGINYDIGNSASYGFDPEEEIKSYGNRILNVHIKDRLLHGTTVPLGFGNANIQNVIKILKNINYDGNYILQTARAMDSSHEVVLCQYRDQVIEWMQ